MRIPASEVKNTVNLAHSLELRYTVFYEENISCLISYYNMSLLNDLKAFSHIFIGKTYNELSLYKIFMIRVRLMYAKAIKYSHFIVKKTK